MNSDNTMLAGRTIDYGPFGFMEKFDPFFQPFTSDTDGKFSYLRQPNAMSINVAVLGSTAFTALVKAVSQSPEELGRCLSDVEHIRDKEFANFFWTAYDDVRRRKLGFKHFSEETDGEFWLELQNLMHKSESDFTIFFRELSTAAGSADSLAALLVLQRSFSQPEDSSRDAAPTAAMTSFNEMDEKLKASWLQWLDKYLARIQSDNRPVDDRRQEQNLANPKYIIRNWMSVLAYESAAEKADYSVIDELMTLLQRPYEEGTLQQEQRWYRSTPPWARNMPGVAFMS